MRTSRFVPALLIMLATCSSLTATVQGAESSSVDRTASGIRQNSGVLRLHPKEEFFRRERNAQVTALQQIWGILSKAGAPLVLIELRREVTDELVYVYSPASGLTTP